MGIKENVVKRRYYYMIYSEISQDIYMSGHVYAESMAKATMMVTDLANKHHMKIRAVELVEK